MHWDRLRLLAALVAVVLAMPWSGTAYGSAARIDHDRWIDLAWVVPGPADVPEAGYTIMDGGRYEDEVDSGLCCEGLGDPGDLDAATSGFIQSYVGWLSGPGDGASGSHARAVKTHVTQFLDETSGLAGWEILLARIEADGGSVLETRDGSGSRSATFRLSGRDGDGREFVSAGVQVLQPPVIVSLQVLDYTGEMPSGSLPKTIIGPVLERAAALATRPAPGPSRMVPRYGTMNREEYRRRDGENLPLGLAAGVEPDELTNDRDGVVSTYVWDATISLAGSPDVGWSGAIWSMQSDGLAQTYAERAVAEWLRQPPAGVSGVEAIPLADPADPRRMVAFTWLPPGSDAAARGYRVWFSHGTLAASIEAVAGTGIRYAAFDRASMQGLACLTLFGCPVAMIAPQLAASSAEASLLEPARAAASVDPVAPSADAPAPLLDLAWIAPRPSDLPGAGYGLIERSGWTTAADQFDWMLDDKPQQAALFADVTANMGWRQAWSGSRATPLPDAPDLYARRLHVELTQTETAAGAHDLSRGLALFALPSIGFVPASPIPGSAPGVVRFRADGVFPDGTSYHLASMLVPDGDVVMFFTLTDFTGDIPAFSEVAMLVAPVQARLAKARAGEPTGLAMQVPRYGWEGMPSPDLDYLMVDGAVQQPFGATAAEVESIEIQLVIDEAREMIRGWTPLPASRQTTASLGVWQTLVRFSNVDAADSFIDRGADDLLEGYLPGTAQMDLVMDLPSGDRAVLVTYLTSEGPNQPWWQAADLWVRVGTRVAWTGVIAPADLPRADLERLARQAAKCLETGDCAEFQPLPASLLVDPAPVIRPPADRLQPTA